MLMRKQYHLPPSNNTQKSCTHANAIHLGKEHITLNSVSQKSGYLHNSEIFELAKIADFFMNLYAVFDAEQFWQNDIFPKNAV